MLDKDKLLDHMKSKVSSFKREHEVTNDDFRQEKLWGEIKILEFYIEAIEIGKFDTKMNMD